MLLEVGGCFRDDKFKEASNNRTIQDVIWDYIIAGS